MKKSGSSKGFTRRQLLKGSASAANTAAVLIAARAAFPAGAFAKYGVPNSEIAMRHGREGAYGARLRKGSS